MVGNRATDALSAVGGLLDAVIEDPLLDGFRHAIRVWVFGTAAFLDLGADTTDFERLLGFVEGVAVVARDLAGLGEVAELFGELQQ